MAINRWLIAIWIFPEGNVKWSSVLDVPFPVYCGWLCRCPEHPTLTHKKFNIFRSRNIRPTVFVYLLAWLLPLCFSLPSARYSSFCFHSPASHYFELIPLWITSSLKICHQRNIFILFSQHRRNRSFLYPCERIWTEHIRKEKMRRKWKPTIRKDTKNETVAFYVRTWRMLKRLLPHSPP